MMDCVLSSDGATNNVVSAFIGAGQTRRIIFSFRVIT